MLEFTLVRLGWTFSLDFNSLISQVIWVIGASMIVLAGLIHLPRTAILGFAAVTIVGHNVLDGIRAADFGSAGWVSNFLHEPGLLKLGNETTLFALYPLIPWVGVMALGYCLGPLFKLEPEVRGRALIAFGAAISLGFILLRAINLYGDLSPGPCRKA